MKERIALHDGHIGIIGKKVKNTKNHFFIYLIFRADTY
jgi:hypothetical protein